MGEGTSAEEALLERPHAADLQRSQWRYRTTPRGALVGIAFGAFFAAIVPVFALLHWFTWGSAGWPQVLAVQIAISLGGIALVIRQLRVFVGVTDTRIAGNGIFSRAVCVPLDAIERFEYVRVFSGQDADPTLQLLALSPGGDALFRLRCYYWHRRDLDALIAASGIPGSERADAVGRSEFYAAYPGSRYWFEGDPRVRIAAAAGTVVAVIAAAIWLTSLLR